MGVRKLGILILIGFLSTSLCFMPSAQAIVHSISAGESIYVSVTVNAGDTIHYSLDSQPDFSGSELPINCWIEDSSGNRLVNNPGVYHYSGYFAVSNAGTYRVYFENPDPAQSVDVDITAYKSGSFSSFLSSYQLYILIAIIAVAAAVIAISVIRSKKDE